MKNLELYNLVKQLLNDGKIFSVTFVKKNGEERTMRARMGVKSHLKGGSLTYDPTTKNNLIVFSMDDNGYRTINVDSILRLKANGVVFQK